MFYITLNVKNILIEKVAELLESCRFFVRTRNGVYKLVNQAIMLFSLIENLPIDLVGATILHYLDIKDIVGLERACGSKSSHQHFLNLIPRSPPISISSCKNISCFEWFVNRRGKIKCLTITMPGNNPALQVKNLQVENLDLCLKDSVTIECCKDLLKSHLICRVRRIKVFADQNKEVIDQLSLLTGNVEELKVSGSNNYNDWLSNDILSRWKLKEFILYQSIGNISTFTSILQSCSELTRIKLNDNNIDDSVIIAFVQHCPKIQQLELSVCLNITYNSLLTLSESKLPLKELGIEYIPNIPSTDIARRCSHALSCIRSLHTYDLEQNNQDANILIPYMTGLTKVFLDEHCHYIPLLAQYCHKLTYIEISKYTNPMTDVLALCCTNPLLADITCYKRYGFTDTTLIELVHACPHLHTLYLSYETEITDIGILALSEHCPQLQELDMHNSKTITETAVLQLLQRCHKLTRLYVSSSSLSEETWTQLDKNTQKRVNRSE